MKDTAFSLKYLLSRSLTSLMTSYDPESWKLLRIIITVSKHRFQVTWRVFQPNYSSPQRPALRTIDWPSFANRNTTIDEPNPSRNFSQITPSSRGKLFSLSLTSPHKRYRAILYRILLVDSTVTQFLALSDRRGNQSLRFLLFIKLKMCWNIASVSCWTLKVPDNLSFETTRWCDISLPE